MVLSECAVDVCVVKYIDFLFCYLQKIVRISY